MAKDKTKKSKPASGGNSASFSEGFAKPSEAPAGGDGWNMTEEAEGKLLLFMPLREERVETADFGEKPVIVADVVVLNEKKPAKSEAHAEVFVWGGYLRGALRGFIGERRVLGRLVRGTTKERGNFPWLLEDATDEETAIAVAYLESVDPFAN